MSIPAGSIKRPVAIAMLYTAIAFIGALSLHRLPIDLLPDIAYPKLVIYTTYPNIPPSEIEQVITTPIENALNRIPGKEKLESVSREGLSIVTVRFSWGTNMDFAVLNVRDKLDGVRASLPDGAEPPVLLRTDPTAEPIMSLSVTSADHDLRNLRELGESVIRRRLEQLDGVAQASVVGGVEREIHIDIDPTTLDAQGITLPNVKNALDQANVAGHGGTILQGLYRYSLRTIGEFQSVQEIGDVVIPKVTTAGVADPLAGRSVPLRQIATITDGLKDRESIIRYNGSEAIGILLFKEAGANTVVVSDTVHKVLAQLRREYPQLTIDVASDQAGFISAALSNVEQEVWLGGLLAFIVLFFFMRDVRYPIAIALSMPLSVVATFALLDATHTSLNIMSLGGLALGVGLLMDNSIVVIENIFRHRELGLAPAAAAALGTEEVQVAITGSTLTTIAVFGPIIYVEGVAGQLFGALSLAVAFSLAISVVVAITLLPMMASHWGDEAAEAEARPTFVRRTLRAVGRGISVPVSRTFTPVFDTFDRGFAHFTEWYEHFLAAALRHRGRVVAMALTMFAITIVLGLDLKRSMLPKVDQGEFRVQLTLPLGTPIAETETQAAQLETIIRKDSAVDAIFTLVGRQIAVSGLSEDESGLNTAVLDVRLKAGTTTPPVVARLTPAFSQFPLGTVAVLTNEATALNRLLGGSDADLSVQVSANDPDSAFAYAQLLAPRLAAIPSLANVQLDTRLGQPETRVEVVRDRAASLGLTPNQIGTAVQTYMSGVTTGNPFPEFDRQVPILVRLPEDDRTSLDKLMEMRVASPSGLTVPLREVITTHDLVGPAEIHRVNQKRYVGVQADVVSGDLASATQAIQNAIGTRPPGMEIKIAGENEEMHRSFVALTLAIILAILLCYMILAAEFESFVHPFTVLLSVPLGTFGAVVALWLTGAGLNTVSLIGMVVLVGIVDNDAVVKVDFINQSRREGMSVRDAIYAAGHARLRPIVINTITALFGLLPMALGIGPGAQLQAPLAIAVFGGLITATALTLVVIPVVYDLLEELRLRVRTMFGWDAVEIVGATPELVAGD